MMLSSSVDVPSPGGMSAVAARNVVRSSSISGAMYSLEKSPSSTGPDATGLVGNKKRRSSLGAKMVAIVGLSQWSKSTLQLNQQANQNDQMAQLNDELQYDSTCRIGRKKADEDQLQPTVQNTLRKLSRQTNKNCPTASRRLADLLECSITLMPTFINNISILELHCVLQLMLVRKVRFIKDDLFSVLSSPSRADESQGLGLLKVWGGKQFDSRVHLSGASGSVPQHLSALILDNSFTLLCHISSSTHQRFQPSNLM
ncbi:Regulating synaptic membrane exocytosis protein 3 [Anabarilius grahami]|uniref:Regulating synaptic membrane exocytosis protein 3 n=1 Tax=Anabarilius grahami TaxID=495550 RepID=A0A3N0XYW9_ANAGA|nr:Regulating synaptic membrane exocytosis protein 3 [Anabarilius grahami]